MCMLLAREMDQGVAQRLRLKLSARQRAERRHAVVSRAIRDQAHRTLAHNRAVQRAHCCTAAASLLLADGDKVSIEDQMDLKVTNSLLATAPAAPESDPRHTSTDAVAALIHSIRPSSAVFETFNLGGKKMPTSLEMFQNLC